MQTVIIGCGIIGVSTAYHLVELGCPPGSISIFEASERPFSGASGYAGGFLAADWYSRAVTPLGRLSFQLHKELAERHDGRTLWGYTDSTGISLGAEGDSGDKNGENGADWLLEGKSRAQLVDTVARDPKRHWAAPPWLKVGPRQEVEILSTADTTAQVDPLRLCHFLLQYCQARGVKLYTETVVTHLSSSPPESAKYLQTSSGVALPCDRLVITSGPWTTQVLKTIFPLSPQLVQKYPIGSLGGHSIVVESLHWPQEGQQRKEKDIGTHAVFATTFSASKEVSGNMAFAPEIFSREPNEIYIAGLNTAGASLPSRADLSKSDAESTKALAEVAKKLLELENTVDVQIKRAGFCFRPTTASGRPYISKVPDAVLREEDRFGGHGGLWVSAGHGPWGISLSQGTGRLLAEMILGFEPSVDPAAFAP